MVSDSLVFHAYLMAHEKAKTGTFTTQEQEPPSFSGSSLEWDYMVALEAVRLFASRLSYHRHLKLEEQELLEKLGVKI